MVKKYSYFIFILSLFFITFSYAQTVVKSQKVPVATAQEKAQKTTIEGLNFYPNPVSTGKIYISSKSEEDKEVIIYNVLGRQVIPSTFTDKELNISSLSPGVYLIRIREGEVSETRKLIVK
jgi:hypothetical protein